MKQASDTLRRERGEDENGNQAGEGNGM